MAAQESHRCRWLLLLQMLLHNRDEVSLVAVVVEGRG
jgi:hypothetical protein